MPTSAPSPRDTEPADTPRSVRSRGGRKRGLVPLVLAIVATLVLGGASVAGALTAPPLDAHTDLEFSLDGANWTDAPDLVLGAWGCDVFGGPVVSDPGGALGGTPRVEPCSMSPGESIDRTYHVRNASRSGRIGRYAVGVGDYLVSGEAEFDVSSSITGSAGADSQTVTLYGADTPQAADSPARGSTVAALDLGPGQSARVVDEVSVSRDVQNYAQRQSVSPMIWVSFTETGELDTDRDGLPDPVENQLGTDPTDPLNRLPDGTVGQHYGPEPFLPTPPAGTELVVDTRTLPPGMRLEDGVLVGTPTRAGTYDVEFTVTMPGGASYTSVRRVVINSVSGGGSTELPDFIWPFVVFGVIGAIVGILGQTLGFLGGSIGGLPGGSIGSGGLPTAPGDSSGSGASSGGSSGSDSGPDGTGDPNATGDPGGAATDGGRGGRSDGGAESGQVDANAVTPRDGAPSSEWTRANSQVRGSLAETGVGAAELALWALTAAAAGVTMLLLASRRRDHGPES